MRMAAWTDLVESSDDELSNFDIGFLHLLCAKGLPGAEDLDIDRCISQLNAMAELVRVFTERLRPRFETHPERFSNSEGRFQMICLSTVLRRDLGISATDKLNEAPVCLDSADLFLHGILAGSPGNCSSLPVLYTAIGRRLGYPLKLARTTCHLFARWESPDERFNIECTAPGLDTPPDEYYLTWPRKADWFTAKQGLFLKSQSPRRDLAGFLMQRSYCLLHNKRHREALESSVAACILSPEDHLHRASVVDMIRSWEDELNGKMPRYFPKVVMRPPVSRRYDEFVISDDIEWNILRLEGIEDLLSNKKMQEQYWKHLREKPDPWPEHLPDQIEINVEPRPRFRRKS